MNNLIKSESINFTELVKKSNVNVLSESVQSTMVTMLNQEFNEEEQRWYIANLYVYMHYHPTNDFPINLDHVFKMIGFANKGNAMKTIKSNFVVNEDYKVVFFRTEKNLLGGRPTEDIMLNVDTFKNLCMIAKTEKGKAIRKYYVKLENIYNKLIQEEMQKKEELLIRERENIKLELTYDLQKKDQLLESTERQLQSTLKAKQLEKHNLLLREFGISTTPIIYIIKVKTLNEHKYIIKIGESRRGVQDRYNEHKINYRDEEIVVLDCFSVNRSKDFEKFLHNHTDIKPSKVTNLVGHESAMELFLIGEDLSYNTVLNIIKENIKHFNNTDGFELEKLRLENENLRLQLELKVRPRDENITREFLNNKIDQLEKNLTKLIQTQFITKTTTGFNEPLRTLGPRLQKINPDTMQLVKVYESVSECIKENSQIKRPSLNKAIVENTIYKNFRWVFVDREFDPYVISPILEKTKLTRPQNLGYIAKLNVDKTHILHVYIDRKTAAKLNGISSLDTPVKTGKISNGHYYVLYETLSEELKSTFQQKFILYVNGVGKFDINDNLVEEFVSKYDCVYKEKIGNKTLVKALNDGTLYNGFYYKYTGSKLNVRNINPI
jgi:phage anti-repressor protein